MQVLADHLERFAEPGRDGLVFPSPSGGYLQRNNFRQRYWLPALSKAGVGHFRFHDLRHTHATLAVSLGLDTKTLMKRMGHSSSRAALIYQHAQPDTSVADLFSPVIA